MMVEKLPHPLGVSKDYIKIKDKKVKPRITRYDVALTEEEEEGRLSIKHNCSPYNRQMFYMMFTQNREKYNLIKSIGNGNLDEGFIIYQNEMASRVGLANICLQEMREKKVLVALSRIMGKSSSYLSRVSVKGGIPVTTDLRTWNTAQTIIEAWEKYKRKKYGR